ncbi:MAG: ribosomal-processing cysteine protease Prp [Oscillospiraceae bacterium]
MITVQLSGTVLTVRGRAGFSRYGSDIVCAAASMLAFTLAAAMEEAGLQRAPEIESACGNFRIAVRPGKVSGRGWRRCSPPSARGTGCLRRGIRNMCGSWTRTVLKIAGRDPKTARRTGRRRRRMEKLEWLQAFAEPEQPENGAAAPTPEQQERLAALSPEGTQALTQEQREAAMRQGYARLKAQFAAVQAVYPQAELSRALEDPRFLRLVTHGVDAKSAYELTHLRELTAEAMAYGARRAPRS